MSGIRCLIYKTKTAYNEVWRRNKVSDTLKVFEKKIHFFQEWVTYGSIVFVWNQSELLVYIWRKNFVFHLHDLYIVTHPAFKVCLNRIDLTMSQRCACLKICSLAMKSFKNCTVSTGDIQWNPLTAITIDQKKGEVKSKGLNNKRFFIAVWSLTETSAWSTIILFL